MKHAWWLLGLLAIGCASGRSNHDKEQVIALSEVPANVKDAAMKAVPGLVLTEAEKEIEKGTTLYCLKGTAGGKTHEVEVTEAGVVQEIESGDDHDDDADDDHDDDHGDDDDKDDDG